MADAEVVLSPGDVARRLGVSPSGLRRLAGVYAELYGELPKDSSGTSRLWSPEAVRRLQAARALMAAGRARSICDALQAVEGGAAPPVEMATAGGDVAAALGVVAVRLEALQASNERLEAEVEALRAELPRQGRQAEVPTLSSLRPKAFGAGDWATDPPEGSGVSRADLSGADGLREEFFVSLYFFELPV